MKNKVDRQSGDSGGQFLEKFAEKKVNPIGMLSVRPIQSKEKLQSLGGNSWDNHELGVGNIKPRLLGDNSHVTFVTQLAITWDAMSKRDRSETWRTYKKKGFSIEEKNYLSKEKRERADKNRSQCSFTSCEQMKDSWTKSGRWVIVASISFSSPNVDDSVWTEPTTRWASEFERNVGKEESRPWRQLGLSQNTWRVFWRTRMSSDCGRQREKMRITEKEPPSEREKLTDMARKAAAWWKVFPVDNHFEDSIKVWDLLRREVRDIWLDVVISYRAFDGFTNSRYLTWSN